MNGGVGSLEQKYFESGSNEAKEAEQRKDKNFELNDGFNENDFLKEKDGFNESDFLNWKIENKNDGFNEEDFLNKEQSDSKKKGETSIEGVKKGAEYMSLATGGVDASDMLEIVGEAAIEKKKNEREQENNEDEEDSLENREQMNEKNPDSIEPLTHEDQTEVKQLNDFNESKFDSKQRLENREESSVNQTERESFQLDESSWNEASVEEKRELLNKYHQELHEQLGIEKKCKDIRFYTNVHTETNDSSFHQGLNQIDFNEQHFDDFDKAISVLSRETYKAYMFQEMHKKYLGEPCDERADEWDASNFQDNIKIAIKDYRKNAFKEDAEAFAQAQLERVHQQSEIGEEVEFSDVNEKNGQLEELQQDYGKKFATSMKEVELEGKDWDASSFEERKELVQRAFKKTAENELEDPPRLVFEAPNNGDVIKGDQIIVGEYKKEKNELYVHPSALGMINDEIAQECAAHGLALSKFYEERQKESESVDSNDHPIEARPKSDQRVEQANDILDESSERDRLTAQKAKNEFEEFMDKNLENNKEKNEFDKFMDENLENNEAKNELEEFMERDERKTKDQKESDNLSEQEAFNKLIDSGPSTSIWDKLIEAREQRFEAAKEQVDEFTWGEKSLEEQMAAIKHVGEYISTEQLNLKEPPTIKFYDKRPKEKDDEISCGYYTKENNTVFINQYILGDVQETVGTLAHELKHAKQYEMKEDWDRTQRFKMFRSRVENRVQSLLANPNLEPVKDWSRNFGRNIFGKKNYVQSIVDFKAYKDQPVEVDADNYEAKIKRMFFGKKKR